MNNRYSSAVKLHITKKKLFQSITTTHIAKKVYYVYDVKNDTLKMTVTEKTVKKLLFEKILQHIWYLLNDTELRRTLNSIA